MALPAESQWRDVVTHGLRYLDRIMRDRVDGGWFARVSRAGQPLEGGTKHAHGTAYLISCGAVVHALTGEALPLAIADDAFRWLESTLHDAEHGGYHGWATSDGKPILSVADLPARLAGESMDHMGHEVGLKDANVHSDLLDALTLLAGVSAEPLVAQRLAEVYEVLTSAFITPAGSVHYLVRPDLTPVAGPEQYGYPLQTGFRLHAAADLLGRDVADADALARKMLDHALEFGWDETRRGFVATRPAVGRRRRPWWVQTEGAKLLLSVALDRPTPGLYHDLFDVQLAVIDRDYVDHRRGGWEMAARSDQSRASRLAPNSQLPKSDIWKDASHEADMYLAAIRMLRGLAANEAID
jgi:mannobiose 2-epimerase